MDSKIIFLIVGVFVLIVIITAVILNFLTDKTISPEQAAYQTAAQPSAPSSKVIPVIEQKIGISDEQIQRAVMSMEPYIRKVALDAAALKTDEASLSVSQQNTISSRLESQSQSIVALNSRIIDMSKRLDNFEARLAMFQSEISKTQITKEELTAPVPAFDPSVLNEINKNISLLKEDVTELKTLSSRNSKRIEQLKSLIVHPKSTHFKWDD